MSEHVDAQTVIQAIEALFEELDRSQEKRLRRMAAKIAPSLTDDDLLQPHDFPELRDNPTFNYEDGILAGIRSAHIAMRARVLRVIRDGEKL